MADNVLVTRGLCKRYGATMAVDHVDLRVEHGQIYGLVGKNGAGKTTVIKMLSCLTPPRRAGRAEGKSSYSGRPTRVLSAGCGNGWAQ